MQTSDPRPRSSTKGTRKTNALDPGDTIDLTGEVTIVHDDGKVTFWLKGFDTPITLRAELVSLIAKKASRR